MKLNASTEWPPADVHVVSSSGKSVNFPQRRSRSKSSVNRSTRTRNWSFYLSVRPILFSLANYVVQYAQVPAFDLCISLSMTNHLWNGSITLFVDFILSYYLFDLITLFIYLLNFLKVIYQLSLVISVTANHPRVPGSSPVATKIVINLITFFN